VVQVVRGHDLVLDTLVVELDGVFSIVASEHKQVLYSELIVLAPPQTQTLLLHLAFTVAFDRLRVKQIENLLIVNLQEGNVDVDSLGLLSSLGLAEDFVDGPDCETSVPNAAVELDFASPLISLLLLVLVALHGEGLARACLPIREYCGMVSFDDFADESADLEVVVHLLLSVPLVHNLVELERLQLALSVRYRYRILVLVQLKEVLLVTILQLVLE